MGTAKEIFSHLIQIGMVTNDIEKTLKDLEITLGIGPFRVVQYPPESESNCERVYRDFPADFSGKFCFFAFDNIEFEVIQPISGKNIWSEFLDQNNGPGLHHLKYLVDSHDEVRKHFDSLGIREVQRGASVGLNKGRVWAYYDTYETCGFYTEVMNDKKIEEKP